MMKLDNKKSLRLIFTLSIAAMVLIGLNGCGFMYGPHGQRQGMMDGWAIGPLGMIFTVILWGLAIVGLIAIFKGFFTKGNVSNNKEISVPSALEILKERYARGEIDKEEFETKKNDLSY
jgi:putative membrane protein